jgi:phenylpyruvate tautomerase PptA (4-oxalocrotonate tautomerase family)
MPLIEVRAFEHRFDDDAVVAQLIEQLTDAFVRVYGEELRPQVEVVVHPIPKRLWGFGGATRA